jgi:ribosomal protein RSM22 (predicted rRNA methylase)
MNPLTIKAQSLKFESKIQWSTARRLKKPRKAQEGHLEEGKPQKSTKSKKNGKTKQNGKKELRKAQKSKKSSKLRQKVKMNTKAQNQYSP